MVVYIQNSIKTWSHFSGTYQILQQPSVFLIVTLHVVCSQKVAGVEDRRTFALLYSLLNSSACNRLQSTMIAPLEENQIWLFTIKL